MIQIFDKLQQINVLISISSTLHIHIKRVVYFHSKGHSYLNQHINELELFLEEKLVNH
jgi:hypothetical protein